jgi:hypothetical protein
MSVLPTHPLQPAKDETTPTSMHVPQFMHLPWPKMVKDQGSHRNSWDPRGEPACTQETQFFSLVEGGWVFWIFVVANMFSSSYPSSQLGFTTYSQVPSVFSNNTSLYSITFALSSTLVTYKQTKKRIQTVQSLIICLMGHSMMPITKGKKTTLGVPTTN